MNRKMKVPALLLAFCLLLTTTALAAGTGSIIMHMEYDNETVIGGTLELYLVAAATDGAWILTDDFAGSGIDLSDIDSADTAQALADYAAAQDLEPWQTLTNDSGTVVFDDLPEALYLVVQTEAADGYELLTPFLVSIPLTVDGESTWDVDAYSKFALEKEDSDAPSGGGGGTFDPDPDPTPAPEPDPDPAPEPDDDPDADDEPDDDDDEPEDMDDAEDEDTPDEADEPEPEDHEDDTHPDDEEDDSEDEDEPEDESEQEESPDEEEIPDTGQLNWPVPVLAAAGMILLMLGYVLRRSGETDA